MIFAFIVIAWVIALGSWFFVSNATAGVAGLCFACFIAITARIVQADLHHTQFMATLTKPVRVIAERTATPGPPHSSDVH